MVDLTPWAPAFLAAGAAGGWFFTWVTERSRRKLATEDWHRQRAQDDMVWHRQQKMDVFADFLEVMAKLQEHAGSFLVLLADGAGMKSPTEEEREAHSRRAVMKSDEVLELAMRASGIAARIGVVAPGSTYDEARAFIQSVVAEGVSEQTELLRTQLLAHMRQDLGLVRP